MLLLLMTVACGRAALPPITDAELAARAREDYLQTCARCHGTDGRGGGATETPGGPPAPDLTRLAARLGTQFSRQYVADVITGERAVPEHGGREMPVWQYRFGRVESGAEAAGALAAQRRLDALAAYVESLQASPAPPVER